MDNKVIASITILNGDKFEVTFIDRKAELLMDKPIGFFLKVRLVDGSFVEFPYSSILKIEYKS